MRYYIGVDSGGTKTDSVLFDGIGRVLCHRCDVGCNPNDIGADAALDKLSSIIKSLAAQSPEKVSSAFAGVAGIAAFADEFGAALAERTKIPALRAGGDAIPLLAASFNRSDGCCVISGTGVSCFYRKGGEIGRVGGWGYLFDGAGGGFDLGRDAIAAVLHEYDGQGEETVLTGLLTNRMGSHPKDIINMIYSRGRSYVASFADAVFVGCRLGDRVSQNIMTRNAQEIARLIEVAGRNFGPIFSVSLGGGVFINNPAYSAKLRELVSGKINLTVNTTPAVYGSAVEAVYSSGNQVPYGFRDNFIGTYRG